MGYVFSPNGGPPQWVRLSEWLGFLRADKWAWMLYSVCMKPASVIVRYDGPALSGHRMDVADLAPALLGLSELCKLANERFNGNSTAVKVLIGADTEQKCFQFSLEVVQTIFQQAQGLLEHKEVKTAKEILEWLGLIGGPIAGVFGLFKLWKRIAGHDVTEEKMTVQDGRNIVQLHIRGNNNTVFAYKESYDLLKLEAARHNARRVLAPVTKPGYEELEFELDGAIQDHFSKGEAMAVLEVPEIPEPDVPLGEPQPLTAFVGVYAPVYDEKATRWRFTFNGGHEYMDISDTQIASDAVRRGGAMVNDLYQVRLSMQQFRTSEGRLSARYKILEVLDFKPARLPHQFPLPGVNDERVDEA